MVALSRRKRSFLDLAKGLLPKATKSDKVYIDRSEHVVVGPVPAASARAEVDLAALQHNVDPARALVVDLWCQAIKSSPPDAMVHQMRLPAKNGDHAAAAAAAPRGGPRRSAIMPQSHAHIAQTHLMKTHVHAALLHSLGGSDSQGHWKSPVMSPPSSHSDCRGGPSTATPPKRKLSAGELAVEALQQQLDRQKADADATGPARTSPAGSRPMLLTSLSADLYPAARQTGAQRRLSVPPTQVPAEVLAHASERDARRHTPSCFSSAPDPDGARHARGFTPVRDCKTELLRLRASAVTFALPQPPLAAGLGSTAAERPETGRQERRGEAVPGAYAQGGGRRQTGPPPPHAVVQQEGEAEQQQQQAEAAADGQEAEEAEAATPSVHRSSPVGLRSPPPAEDESDDESDNSILSEYCWSPHAAAATRGGIYCGGGGGGNVRPAATGCRRHTVRVSPSSASRKAEAQRLGLLGGGGAAAVGAVGGGSPGSGRRIARLATGAGRARPVDRGCNDTDSDSDSD
jgi:hypothetical protein